MTYEDRDLEREEAYDDGYRDGKEEILLSFTDGFRDFAQGFPKDMPVTPENLVDEWNTMVMKMNQALSAADFSMAEILDLEKQLEQSPSPIDRG